MASFYKGKRVFVTGHTGFKGSWLCKILELEGANVVGYALSPSTNPSLFEDAAIGGSMHSVIADIRDYNSLYAAFEAAKPEIVFHLAAQPLVLDGYKEPRATYEINVMGTVNLLDCVRNLPGVKSVVNVTTDKVYLNEEWCWGYREEDRLNGFDPYSNSKSCSELVTSSFIKSYFADMDIPVSTVRAGNVIGGGDYSDNRIIPDCVQAAYTGKKIQVRNPHSIRPYQHVLEPLFAYLMIAQKQYEQHTLAGSYNIGPDDCDCVTTQTLVTHFCEAWQNGIGWECRNIEKAPHEAGFLKLDCSKAKQTFSWSPAWNIQTAVQKTVEFAKDRQQGIAAAEIMARQIQQYKEDFTHE